MEQMALNFDPFAVAFSCDLPLIGQPSPAS